MALGSADSCQRHAYQRHAYQRHAYQRHIFGTNYGTYGSPAGEGCPGIRGELVIMAVDQHRTKMAVSSRWQSALDGR